MDCITQTPEFSLELTEAPVIKRKPNKVNTKKRKPRTCRSPAWSRPDCIHHEIDKDLVKRLKNPDGKYDAVWFMDPHYDPEENRYHINWSDDDIEKLWNGIVESQLDYLAYAKNTEGKWFVACIQFFNSDIFESFCISEGMSVSNFRNELATQLKAKFGYIADFKEPLLDCDADFIEVALNKSL